MALWPEPRGSIGWRLWQMTGCTQEQYIRGFDRRNITNDGSRKYKIVEEAWAATKGRRIIIVGRVACEWLRLPIRHWILPSTDLYGREWRMIPETRKEYEEPVFRLCVSLLLKDWWINYSGLEKK